MIENYRDILKNKFATAEGRASRSEFWLFFLANFIITFVLSLITGFIKIPFIVSLYALAIFVPNICVGIRRLHDTGKSGWWMLIGLTGIGCIVLLIFYCLDSDSGNNAYGPNPNRVYRTSGENYYNANTTTVTSAVRQEALSNPVNQQSDDPQPAKAHPIWVPEADDDLYEEKTTAFYDDMTVSIEDDEKTVALIDDRMPMVKLTRLADSKTISCQGNVFTVGKSLKSSDYSITDNDKVSRKHATFYVKDGQYFIVDSSKNGTRINGVPAAEGTEFPVSDGDRIEFADESFIFSISK